MFTEDDIHRGRWTGPSDSEEMRDRLDWLKEMDNKGQLLGETVSTRNGLLTITARWVDVENNADD